MGKRDLIIMRGKPATNTTKGPWVMSSITNWTSTVAADAAVIAPAAALVATPPGPTTATTTAAASTQPASLVGQQTACLPDGVGLPATPGMGHPLRFGCRHRPGG